MIKEIENSEDLEYLLALDKCVDDDILNPSNRFRLESLLEVKNAIRDRLMILPKKEIRFHYDTIYGHDYLYELIENDKFHDIVELLDIRDALCEKLFISDLSKITRIWESIDEAYSTRVEELFDIDKLFDISIRDKDTYTKTVYKGNFIISYESANDIFYITIHEKRNV